MSIALPTPIQAYLHADASGDIAAVAACFTDDAQVSDEGQWIRGVAAIEDWKRRSKAKYRYAVEPLSVAAQAEIVRMLARLTGDFPGSPLEVTYTFKLRGDRIASLEIR
jgi:ketosteroid isomerase-like protein